MLPGGHLSLWEPDRTARQAPLPFAKSNDSASLKIFCLLGSTAKDATLMSNLCLEMKKHGVGTISLSGAAEPWSQPRQRSRRWTMLQSCCVCRRLCCFPSPPRQPCNHLRSGLPTLPCCSQCRPCWLPFFRASFATAAAAGLRCCHARHLAANQTGSQERKGKHACHRCKPGLAAVTAFSFRDVIVVACR